MSIYVMMAKSYAIHFELVNFFLRRMIVDDGWKNNASRLHANGWRTLSGKIDPASAPVKLRRDEAIIEVGAH